jgi:hypothetical protein
MELGEHVKRSQSVFLDSSPGLWRCLCVLWPFIKCLQDAISGLWVSDEDPNEPQP